MMAKLKVIVAVMVFFGVLILGTGLIAQQRTVGGRSQGTDSMNPSLKALIEARIQVAKEIFETTMQRHKETLVKDGVVEDLTAWSRHWMDDQIHLDPNPLKNVAAIQDHLERTKRLEAIVDTYAKTAQGRAEDALKVKYFRLEAEQMLTELRIVNPRLFPSEPAAKP